MTFLTEIPDEEFFNDLNDPIDISILDTDTEEVEEEEELGQILDADLLELRNRASALGVKNVNQLNQGQLEERIQILLRVRSEGLSRLEFDENKELIPSLENLRILEIQAVQKKNTLTRADVLTKLAGYRLITDKFATNNRRWTRYIDVNDGFLRPGGFPIRNQRNEEFIVFKNVSKRFTFSAKRRNIILMEKLPKDAIELISTEGQNIVIDFVGRSGSGTNLVALKDDFTQVSRANNVAALSRLLGVNRGALGRKFRGDTHRFKNYFIFKLSLGDVNDLNELIPLDNANLSGIPADLMAIIDRFYPDRDRPVIPDRDRIEFDEDDDDDDDDEELSEDFFGGDDFLADLFAEVIE